MGNCIHSGVLVHFGMTTLTVLFRMESRMTPLAAELSGTRLACPRNALLSLVRCRWSDASLNAVGKREESPSSRAMGVSRNFGQLAKFTIHPTSTYDFISLGFTTSTTVSCTLDNAKKMRNEKRGGPI